MEGRAPTNISIQFWFGWRPSQTETKNVVTLQKIRLGLLWLNGEPTYLDSHRSTFISISSGQSLPFQCFNTCLFQSKTTMKAWSVVYCSLNFFLSNWVLFITITSSISMKTGQKKTVKKISFQSSCVRDSGYSIQSTCHHGIEYRACERRRIH